MARQAGSQWPRCMTWRRTRMQGHLHKMVGCWLQEHTDIRDEFVRPTEFTVPFCKAIVQKLKAAATAGGRPHPRPKLSERKRLKLEAEAALAAAKAEQDREAAALAALPTDHGPTKKAKVGGE